MQHAELKLRLRLKVLDVLFCAYFCLKTQTETEGLDVLFCAYFCFLSRAVTRAYSCLSLLSQIQNLHSPVLVTCPSKCGMQNAKWDNMLNWNSDLDSRRGCSLLRLFLSAVPSCHQGLLTPISPQPNTESTFTSPRDLSLQMPPDVSKNF